VFSYQSSIYALRRGFEDQVKKEKETKRKIETDEASTLCEGFRQHVWNVLFM
jgi:hypothetical protein